MTDNAARVAAAWDSLEAWMRANAPEALARLRPGASDAALTAAARRLGFPLPEEVKAFYRRHDGGDLGLFDGQEFLSLQAMVESWNVKRGVAADGPEIDDDEAPHGVKGVWWSPGWLPIADTDGFGFYLDLDPAEGGTRGQIIYWASDAGAESLVAPSLADWFESYVADVQAGNVLWLDDGYFSRLDEMEDASAASRSAPERLAASETESSADAGRIDRAWDAFEEWLKANAPELKKALHPGAKEGNVALVEKTYGAKLPESFKRFYLRHDGAKGGVGVVDGAQLLSLNHIAEMAGDLRQHHKDMSALNKQFGGLDKMLRGTAFAGLAGALGASVTAEPMWKPGWIPFAEEFIMRQGRTKMAYLDVDSGEVILLSYFGQKIEAMSTLPSFAVWFEGFVAAVRAGRYAWNADTKALRAITA